MIAATPGAVGISRWLAPELINPPCKKGHHQLPGTQQADIFAFAMLVIEVFTGALPFGDVRHETAILMIARGQRPEKPRGAESRGLTPDIWKFIQKCWNQNPTKRPSIGAIVNAWEAFDSQERCVACSTVHHCLLTPGIGIQATRVCGDHTLDLPREAPATATNALGSTSWPFSPPYRPHPYRHPPRQAKEEKVVLVVLHTVLTPSS